MKEKKNDGAYKHTFIPTNLHVQTHETIGITLSADWHIPIVINSTCKTTQKKCGNERVSEKKTAKENQSIDIGPFLK